jgi:hypothetical protein
MTLGVVCRLENLAVYDRRIGFSVRRRLRGLSDHPDSTLTIFATGHILMLLSFSASSMSSSSLMFTQHHEAKAEC